MRKVKVHPAPVTKAKLLITVVLLMTFIHPGIGVAGSLMWLWLEEDNESVV